LAPKRFFIPALLWTIGIAVACLVSSGTVPKFPLLAKDKIIHAAIYFVFTLLWFLYVKKKYPSVTFYQKAILVLSFAFVYGTLIEVLQEFFTETRKADVLDVMANVSGGILAVAVLRFVQYCKEKRKTKH